MSTVSETINAGCINNGDYPSSENKDRCLIVEGFLNNFMSHGQGTPLRQVGVVDVVNYPHLKEDDFLALRLKIIE